MHLLRRCSGFGHWFRGLGFCGRGDRGYQKPRFAKDVITLDNGSTYDVAKGVKLSSFNVGEKVTVTYTHSAKMMDATAIVRAS